MGYIIGALLIISAKVFATLADSPCACTREFRPVCGSNGETYNSPCLLRCAAFTSGKEIKETKPVPCDETLEELDNCICTYDYKPVCGTDGQTYPNECGLNCHKTRFNKALKVKYPGACRKPRQTSCLCTFIYSPVCGNDGKTYGSICALNCDARSNSRLRLAHKGACAGRG